MIYLYNIKLYIASWTFPCKSIFTRHNNHWRWLIQMMMEVTSVPLSWQHRLRDGLCWCHPQFPRIALATVYLQFYHVIPLYCILIPMSRYNPYMFIPFWHFLGRASLYRQPEHHPMDRGFSEPGPYWWSKWPIPWFENDCFSQHSIEWQDLHQSPYQEPSPGLPRATLSFEGMEPTTQLDHTVSGCTVSNMGAVSCE